MNKTLDELRVEIKHERDALKKAMENFSGNASNPALLKEVRNHLTKVHSLSKKIAPLSDVKLIKEINFNKCKKFTEKTVPDNVRAIIHTELQEKVRDIYEKKYFVFTNQRFCCVILNDDSKINFYNVSIKLYIISKESGLLKTYEILNTNDLNIDLYDAEPNSSEIVITVVLTKPNGEKHCKRMFYDIKEHKGKESLWYRIQ